MGRMARRSGSGDRIPVDLEKIKVAANPWLPGDGEAVQVELLAQGSWNRAYLLKTSDRGGSRELIFRIPLPTYPWYKTESEVATIRFISEKTTIPVPKIYAYDSSAHNELGYEWILMERVPGVQYSELEDELSLDEKLDIARTVANWVHQMSRLRFGSIGSLYFNPGQNGDVQLGRPVIEQFMGD